MGTTRDLTTFMLLVFGIVLLLVVTFSHWEIPGTPNTLTGKVEWVAVDRGNKVSLVAISTETDEYMVGDDAKGKELLQLVNRRVKVKGKITENQNGQRTIHVSKYELVPQ